MQKHLEYYGVVDYAELSGENYFVSVDCLNATQFNEFYLESENAISIFEVIDRIDSAYLSIQIPVDDIRKFVGGGRVDQWEARWVKVFYYYNSDTALTVSQFILGADNIPLQTEQQYNFEFFDGRTKEDRTKLRKLKETVDLGITCVAYIKDEEATALLDTIEPEQLSNVDAICYNVGQGNAVCISENNIPLLYFDIGGGANTNYATYPVTRNFKIGRNKLIVLSHFDEDHYETARRDTRLVDEHTYIAPVQNVVPRNLVFIKEILAKGTLILLSRTFTNHTFSLGILSRCKGHINNKNDCGLTMHLELDKQDDLTSILLPGDTQYRHIPNWRQLDLDALLSTHHGGALNSRGMPACRLLYGCIAYSYGAYNQYGHALAGSILFHEQKSWGVYHLNFINRLDTIGGDIVFSYQPDKMCTCVVERETEDREQVFNNVAVTRTFRINEILADE
jgi:beta-lactamase superfamily II metal-dependent hydrolase